MYSDSVRLSHGSAVDALEEQSGCFNLRKGKLRKGKLRKRKLNELT